MDEKNKENTFIAFNEDIETKLEEIIKNKLDGKNEIKENNIILKKIDLDKDDMINKSIAEKQYKWYNLVYAQNIIKNFRRLNEFIIYNKNIFKKHKRQKKYF